MDLQKASILRAQSALNMALTSDGGPAPAGEFVKHCRAMLTKTATGASTAGAIDAEVLRALAARFLASIRNRNLLDSVARYATEIPEELNRVLVASGTVAGEATEAMPKAIRKLALDAEDMTVKKVVALLVLTRELAEATGQAGERLFRRELENSLIAASNTALLDTLTIDPVGVTGTFLGDLRAGLEAAADSDGYVVAASREAVRSLALGADGRMSATHGGQFVPDVWIVPADVDGLIAIPASRIALKIRNPFVKDASHASIEMSDSPEQPAELVSLFQTNSRALAIERQFEIHAAADAVQVSGSG